MWVIEPYLWTLSNYIFSLPYYFFSKVHWSHYITGHNSTGFQACCLILFIFCLLGIRVTKLILITIKMRSLLILSYTLLHFVFWCTVWPISSIIIYRSEFSTSLPITHSLWSDLYRSFPFYCSTTHIWTSKLSIITSLPGKLLCPFLIFPSKSPNV